MQTPGSTPYFDAQTQFLADNAAALNLKYVLHEGDVTEHNTTPEWDNALEAMNRLNGVVPYAMVTGSHDVGPSPEVASTRQSGFNNPKYFGPGSYYATQPSIGGFSPDGNTANSYHTFTVGDQEWLIMDLEWAPSNPDIAWANQVLDAHPTDRSIVLTHAFMYSDNTRYDWAKYGQGQAYNPHALPPYLAPAPNDTVNDGQEIWDKLIRTHDNVDFVMSGHVLSPGTGYRSDLTDGGHVVHQILANFQDYPQPGFMRLMEFDPDGSIQLRSYSPVSDQYLTRFDEQFTLQLDTLKGPNAPPAPPLISNAVAANLIVSGATNPTANTIGSIQIAQTSSPGFSIPIANRGDIELAVGGTRLQYYHGILLSSISQFDRPDFVGRHATAEVGRNSFGDGIEALSLTEAGNPAANEVNFNTSVAWFQFQAGFRGAHVNPDGSLSIAAFNGVVAANISHPSIGRYSVKLGVNSLSDGLLFATGDNNSNVVVQAGPFADGSGWDVRVASNAQGFGSSLGNQLWSFLYLPYNTPSLVGGYYDGLHDTTISSVGNFTMNRLATGQYQLSIPGETPQTGMLVLSVADLRTIGGVTSPMNDVLAYQPSPDGTFLIDSFNMPGNGLDDVAFDWAFISFTHGLSAAPPIVGTTVPLAGDYNGDNVVDAADYVVWRQSLGSTTELAADGNNDGVVDQGDYDIWRQDFAQSAPPPSGMSISILSVPEPSICAYMILGVAQFQRITRRARGWRKREIDVYSDLPLPT